MRKRILLTALALAHSACFLVLDFDFDTSSAKRDANAPDGSVARGFALRVDPPSLAARQGGGARLHVFIDREPGFTTAVNVGVPSLPPGIDVAAVTVDGADGFLDVAVGAAPAPSRVDLDVTASAGSDNTAHLRVPLDVANSGGAPDRDFADGGLLFVGMRGSIESVALQADGKIVCGGSTDATHGIVLRFTSSGEIDRTFADGGKTFTTGTARDLELLPDGRLLVATHASDGQLTITCLRANGTVDPTYADAGSYAGRCTAMAKSGDKEVVACEHTVFFSLQENRVVRLASNGAVDATWDWIDGGSNVAADDIALTPAGQTLVAYTKERVTPELDLVPTPNVTLVRLSSQAKLDTTYGDAGVASFSFPVTASGYGLPRRLLAGADRVYLAGEAADEVGDHPASVRMIIAGVDAVGQPDTAYANAGFAKLSALPQSWASDAVLLGDGSIVLGGARVDPGGQSLAVVHVSTNGTIDDTFWSPAAAPHTGVAIAAGAAAEARALALQADGKLVVGGYTRDADGGSTMLLGRLLP